MKKLVFLFGIFFALSAGAQKIAFVNTKYILEQIPEYKDAQDKLANLTKEYQTEIEQKQKEIDQMYASYQADKILLSEEMRKEREAELARVRDELTELKQRRFGSKGDLYKERQKLVKPIQDKVYKAIQEVAEKGGYAFILDSSSELAVLYYSPKYDKTDEVLKKLGYL